MYPLRDALVYLSDQLNSCFVTLRAAFIPARPPHSIPPRASLIVSVFSTFGKLIEQYNSYTNLIYIILLYFSYILTMQNAIDAGDKMSLVNWHSLERQSKIRRHGHTVLGIPLRIPVQGDTFARVRGQA